MIWTETVEIATRPLPRGAAGGHAGAIGQLIQALDTVGAEDLREGLRVYAASLLDRVPSLRQAQGESDAVKAGEGEPPEELIRRARDLLLGLLAE